MYPMLKYLALLLLVVFQLCSMCSSKKANTSFVAKDKLRIRIESRNKEPWSDLSIVGYPSVEDTIPSLLLERFCYSVSYNKLTRQPNWVKWQLTEEHMVPKKECVWNEYREDTELPSEILSTLEDYALSRYDR